MCSNLVTGGFRNRANFKTASYFTLGDLDLFPKQPAPAPPYPPSPTDIPDEPRDACLPIVISVEKKDSECMRQQEPADLFAPSLEDARPRKQPYSVRATFLTAFFGGPFAALAFIWLSVRRIGREHADRLLWATALIVTVLVVGAASAWLQMTAPLPGTERFSEGDHDAHSAEPVREGTEQTNEAQRFPTRPLRVGLQLWGLAFVGLFYLRYKAFITAAEMRDELPSPWRAALACIVLGAVVQVVLGLAIVFVARTLARS